MIRFRGCFAVAVSAAVVLGHSSIGHSQFREGEAVAPATRAIIESAQSARASGNTTEALRVLTNYTFTAPPREAAAAKLRLSYLHLAQKDRDQAKVYFQQLLDLPAGVNDIAKGEAALRLAYLNRGEERTRLAERIVAGEFQVSRDDLAEAHHIAAAQAHGRRDLLKAVEFYSTSPSMEPQAAKRTYVLKELAGLYFEMAKGEGKEPIPAEQRPAMWDTARALCQAVIDSDTSTPVEHRMVAELMILETYWFQNEFRHSNNLGLMFLARWGTDPKARSNLNERKYINTCKTLQMQTACVLGELDAAEALAKEFLGSPPTRGEEFSNSDSKLISLVVLKLCAYERGLISDVAAYGQQAADYRRDYIGVERNLSAKRRLHLSATSR